ncbi:MAG TPA: DegV family protein [Anaerolineae bacterium]|nr:DegV family protein [Anaerolineae bacterium]HOQ98687.1 DegV family protein [Anaerolineae bacterium]HPL26651.1 DegV family protein [Anaerolineae bacterium]
MIKVLVDSASSITPPVAATLGLHLIPIKVTFGSESFLDGVDLDAPEFYRRLNSGEPLPVTSQPSPGDFYQVFRRLTDDGSELVCVLMSHQMSGILLSAQTAREMLPGRAIHVFDTLNASTGEALLAMAAVALAAAGRQASEILARLEELRGQVRNYFVVDTLEFLHRGGRIGGASALLGTALRIKPLLQVANGRLEPLDKVRTRPKALARLLDLMEAQTGREAPVWCAVGHGNCLSDALEVEEAVRSRFNWRRTIVLDVGPTISTHSGPGVLTVAMMRDA